MGKLSPIVSEFDSADDEQAYQLWFQAKVRSSIADAGPSTSHASVMLELDRIIDQAESTSHEA